VSLHTRVSPPPTHTRGCRTPHAASRTQGAAATPPAWSTLPRPCPARRITPPPPPSSAAQRLSFGGEEPRAVTPAPPLATPPLDSHPSLPRVATAVAVTSPPAAAAAADHDADGEDDVVLGSDTPKAARGAPHQAATLKAPLPNKAAPVRRREEGGGLACEAA
jgi:hypothetical protein